MGIAEPCRRGEDKVGPELVRASGRPPVRRRPYSDSEATMGLFPCPSVFCQVSARCRLPRRYWTLASPSKPSSRFTLTLFMGSLVFLTVKPLVTEALCLSSVLGAGGLRAEGGWKAEGGDAQTGKLFAVYFNDAKGT